jgi:FAD:protein FMN transferase
MDSMQYHKKFCGCDVFTIDTSQHKIFKKNNKFKIDFGGIAKGYIADKVSKLLDTLGYTRHLIDAGGDLVVGDAPTDAEGWMISIEQPMNQESTDAIVIISNKAIATSGATYQNFTYNDKKVSHIIDPQNGIGVGIGQNITIVTKTGTDADWLATACSILGYPQSKKLIHKYKGSSLIWSEGSKMKKAGAKLRYYK